MKRKKFFMLVVTTKRRGLTQMKVDEYDSWIIRFGNVYLAAKVFDDKDIYRFTESPYNAWHIANASMADRVARMLGGETVKFNPVLGVVTCE